MLFRHLCVGVLATHFVSSVTASKSAIRGGGSSSSNNIGELNEDGNSSPLGNQFTCTLTARDEGTCKATKDDDGKDCVWCSFSGYGFCLSDDIAEQIEDQIPQIQCSSDDVIEKEEEEEDSVVANLVKKVQDDVIDQENIIMDFLSDNDFLDCIKKSTDENTCTSCDSCNWCNLKVSSSDNNQLGVCLAKDAIAMIPADMKSLLLDCGDDDQDDQETSGDDKDDEDSDEDENTIQTIIGDNPYKCTATARDEDTCKSTKDDDGKDCVWCGISGFGACVSDEIAKQIEQTVPQIQCSDTSSSFSFEQENKDIAESELFPSQEDIKEAIEESLVEEDEDEEEEEEEKIEDSVSSFDTSCLFAGGTSDDAQSACDKTKDSNNEACVWCYLSGSNYGVCLSSGEATTVNQFLQCDKEVVSSSVVAQEE